MSYSQDFSRSTRSLGFGGRITWAVQRMILLTCGAFVLSLLLLPLNLFIARSRGIDAMEYLAFTPSSFLHGQLWQPFTYLFRHEGLMHLAGNMITLFFFGPEVEREIGTPQFYRLYFACGIASVFATLLPFFINGHDPSIVGASGAVMGVLTAFVYLDPQRQVYILPFPKPITALWLMIFIVGLNVITSLQGSSISVETHFGGIAAGYVYMKFVPQWTRLWRKRKFRVVPKPAAPRPGGPTDFDKLGKVVNDILKDKERGFPDDQS